MIVSFKYVQRRVFYLMQYECEYQRKGIYMLGFLALPSRRKAKLLDTSEGMERQI